MHRRTVAALLVSLALPALGLSLDAPNAFSQSGGEKKEKEEKKTAPAKVGETAPDFALVDTEGNEHRLSQYLKEEKVVVLEWFNPDCPFVKKHHQKTRSMAETFELAAEHDVVWLAVNSGAPGKQGAGLERNQKAIKEYKIAYPVLLDESGEVGKLYGAKTTPHMYVIDKDGTLLYAGATDDKANATDLGKTNYVRQALEQYWKGVKIDPNTTKPYGCSVKYGS
jgi:peroxiredoxin